MVYFVAYVIDCIKVGGKDILKRTWKDLSEHISLEVSCFCKNFLT